MRFEGLDYPFKCAECGRFMSVEAGCAWKMVYSGGPIPEPDREIFLCRECTGQYGGFAPQSGIKPEYSVGFVTAQRGEGEG